MDKQRIEKIRDSKLAAAQRNYMSFQNSGESRYYRAYESYEELADICNLALDAADDHNRMIHLQVEMNEAGNLAGKIITKWNELEDSEKKDFAYQILNMAKLNGFNAKYVD